MSAKPSLGYATRTEAVLALREAGLNGTQIASKLGIAAKTVTALEHSAGRRRQRPERPSEALGRIVLFPIDVLDRLGPHAARRGVHPNSLARMIVETVVDEGMIDAVLDDGANVEVPR